MGNAKNAGKTTVLNSIVESYSKPLVITSIGLDGELIDQVTFLEKPQIIVRDNDIVATAKDTLKQFKAKYEILKETKIFTAIGAIVICKIKSNGKVLVAGPSTVDDMSLLIKELELLNDYKILIDGAFFRQSFTQVSDATIYVVGANYSSDIYKTVENAKLTYDKLNLPIVAKKYQIFNDYNHVCLIKNKKIVPYGFKSILGHLDEIFNDEIDQVSAIYIPMALTDEFVERWIQSYSQYSFDLVVGSGVHIQLSHQNLKSLFKLSKNIYVLKEIEIACVCMNPFSPRGYGYNQKQFKNNLIHALDTNIIDVKEEEIYE